MSEELKQNQCQNCFKLLSNKYKLEMHLNRKIPCVPKPKEFKCERCKKIFTTKQYLQTHMNKKNICKIKIDLELELQLKIEKEKTKQEEIKLKQVEKELKIIEKKSMIDNYNDVTNIPKIQYCYVISNDVNIAHNRYKFGRTICNQKDLIGCYSRGLPNAQVLLYYETDDYIRDENHVLNHFKEYRLDNASKKSEWLQIEFVLLNDFLDIYFDNQISEEIPNESVDS